MLEEGQVILAPIKDLGLVLTEGKKETLEDEIDVVNDALLEKDNGEIGDAMETDDTGDVGTGAVAANGVDPQNEELDFQNLTEDDLVIPEGELEVDKRESKGLMENQEVDSTTVEKPGDVEKSKAVKKKPTRSVPLLGGTTKQRMLQMASKRPLGKTSSKQSAGEVPGQAQGSLNPKPSTSKP